MGTQQLIPPVGTAVPDNSRSSFANLLIKFLPASIVTRFNLSLFPVDPSPVRVLVIGNFAKQDAKSEPPPNMVWTGGIHAREYAPQEVGIKFLEWLLDNYQTDANARMMLDNNRYHFIVHNPDGRKLAEQDISARQRKNTNYRHRRLHDDERQPPVLNTFSSGVDLNRNYPFGWATGGAGGSDGNTCGETYRGISAGLRARGAGGPELRARHLEPGDLQVEGRRPARRPAEEHDLLQPDEPRQQRHRRARLDRPARPTPTAAASSSTCTATPAPCSGRGAWSARRTASTPTRRTTRAWR